MTKTHNAALATLATGDELGAWMLAKQDDGLLPDVTFEKWIGFARSCLARRAEEEAMPSFDYA